MSEFLSRVKLAVLYPYGNVFSGFEKKNPCFFSLARGCRDEEFYKAILSLSFRLSLDLKRQHVCLL